MSHKSNPIEISQLRQSFHASLAGIPLTHASAQDPQDLSTAQETPSASDYPPDMSDYLRIIGGNLESMDCQELSRLSNDLLQLSNYAQMASTARRYRLAGSISIALRVEANMESCYQTLPASIKW